MRSHETTLDALEEELCILHLERVDQMREARRALVGIIGNAHLPEGFFNRPVDKYSTHELGDKVTVLNELIESKKLPENVTKQVSEAAAALQQIRSSGMAVERLHMTIKPFLPESQTLEEFNHMALIRATEVRTLVIEKGHPAVVKDGATPVAKPNVETVSVPESAAVARTEAAVAETAKAVEADKGIFSTIGTLAKEHWGKATAIGAVIVATAAIVAWNSGKVREQQINRRDSDSPDKSR